MSVLTVTPTPEVFSTIPTLKQVFKEFHDKEVPRLVEAVGQLFVKHNVTEHFGLSMVHRHFDMSTGEILVETVKDDHSLSVAIPWSLEEGSSAKPSNMKMWASYGVTGKKYVVPQNWCFNSSGNLVPFEFLASDDASLPQPTLQFAQELYEALKELGVDGIVGLRSLAHLTGHGSTWETTPHGVQANIVVFGEQPQELKNESMIRVLWTFDKEGRLQAGRAHCGSCTHNCNHCNHCWICM